MSTRIGYPQRVDLELYDWSSGRVRFNVTDSTGAPRDLTGYSALVQVRDGYGGALLLELSEGDGVETGADYVDVAFDGDVIGPAAWGVGFYDLFLRKTLTQDYYAIATGTITVARSVADFS